MESVVIGSFLIFFALELIVEMGLNELNLRYVREHGSAGTMPENLRAKMDSAEFDQSVNYTLAKGRFQRWADLYSRTVLLAVLFSGILPLLDDSARDFGTRFFPVAGGQGIVFCFGVAALFSIAALPANLYATFGIEARFGFNKTTFALYAADRLKGLVLGLVIGVPFLYVVLWLMEAMGRYWWIWVFFFIAGFQFLLIMIYPGFIAPLFNKFEPLRDGELRNRIVQLAELVGFRMSGIYSMDGSRRSAHSNAYFTGIGRSKRIVLFDTLIEQMSTDQSLAVLAHEMGHYKMKHIRRMLVVQSCLLFVGLFLLSILIKWPPLFSAFGLQQTNHAALVLFSLLSGSFTFYLGPIMNLLSRKHEYEADRFAVGALRDSKPMEEALVNLTVKNLANLSPHPWYSFYHYSHPTMVERIEALRRATA